ncbi:hypothetical protein FOL47_007856 [Perkinsus chesapeaki]|uniref:Cytochrome b5 heme-binding domain-containing protein n=1 Tax=Perkinsus chesapeaki TaxID=330153 RepID=A0A7J6LHJ8_PERCH|nr:hypothetical protein FOL47_007856 [Perkinsus chesapeaki]
MSQPSEETSSTKKLPVIDPEEVAKHNKKGDCWVVIHGGVYDVSKFLNEHPGGPDVILAVAGEDVTEDYEGIGHSDAARHIAAEHKIGILKGCERANDIPSLAEVQASSTVAGVGVLPLLIAALIAVAAYYAFAQ